MIEAALWAALHGSLPAVLPVFAIGLLLAWLLRRTGSLRVTIVSHAAQNLLVVHAPFLGLPGPG